MQNTYKNPMSLCLLFTLSLILEYYDFVIYGVFAMYFDSQFFPNNNPLISLMLTYGTFTVGYLSRPIGGLLFAHLSYKYGKKFSLLLAMMIMGLAVLGVGLLPNYAQIGIAAPLLMIAFRVLHGLSLGGDVPVSAVFLYDNFPEKRPLYFGVLFSGIGFGMLLGGIIHTTLVDMLTKEQLYQFGWRIPFLLGSSLCIVSYFIRHLLFKHEDTMSSDMPKRLPIITAFRDYYPLLILGILIIGIQGILSTVTQVYMPSYLIQILHYQPAEIALSVTIGNLCVGSFAILIGYVTYKIWNNQVIYGFILSLILIIALYYFAYHLLIEHKSLTIGIIIISIIKGMISGITLLITMLIFPKWFRITGVAICYNFSMLIFAGFTPLVTTYIINLTHNVYTPAYICIGYSIFLIILLIIFRQKFITRND